MRRTLTLLAGLAFGVGLLAGPALAGDDSGSAPTIQQFLKIRTPGAPVILPDGSLLQRDWRPATRRAS